MIESAIAAAAICCCYDDATSLCPPSSFLFSRDFLIEQQPKQNLKQSNCGAFLFLIVRGNGFYVY